jgi:hypothetical protein
MLYHMVYSSQATRPMSAADLEQILTDARVGNEARNVTGALIHVDGVFVQVLEGEEDVLRALMANIARDTRHHGVKVFYESAIAERAFASWRMAYVSPTAEQVSTWAGLPSTASIESLLADVSRDPRRVPGFLVSMLEALAH